MTVLTHSVLLLVTNVAVFLLIVKVDAFPFVENGNKKPFLFYFAVYVVNYNHLIFVFISMAESYDTEQMLQWLEKKRYKQ